MLFALAGCTDRGTREVTGTVTFDGKPLQSGVIQFIPSPLSAGPRAGAQIENGHFLVKDIAQGMRANGKYQVSIESMVPSGFMVVDPTSPTGASESLKNIIPDRYNYNTELEVTISPDEKNVFLFELTSDAKFLGNSAMVLSSAVFLGGILQCLCDV
jgi:hypothetical protein